MTVIIFVAGHLTGACVGGAMVYLAMRDFGAPRASFPPATALVIPPALTHFEDTDAPTSS